MHDSAELPSSAAAQKRMIAWVKATDPDTTLEVRLLGDGTYLAVRRLLFHYTLIYGVLGDQIGYEDRWCYPTAAAASAGMWGWTSYPEGEPAGWHRHPKSGRRRPDCDASREYVDG